MKIKEIQNRDWQYLVELVIKLVEHDKTCLKPLPKAERKIIKSRKHNYRLLKEFMHQHRHTWQNNLKFI